MSDDPGFADRPKAFETIVYGGLAIGTRSLRREHFFPAVLRYYDPASLAGGAAGVLGRKTSVAGGWNTALLEIFLHFVLASCIAIVYFLIADTLSM